MNIHDGIMRIRVDRGHGYLPKVYIAAFFACILGPHFVRAASDAPTPGLIQQLVVDGSTGYRIIHEEGDESMAPRMALLRFRTGATEVEAKTTFALMYGWRKDSHSLSDRWRFSRDSIYMGLSVTTASPLFLGTISQFRISELDSGRPVRGRVDGRKRAESKLSHLSLQLRPISQAITGFLILTETGHGRPKRVVDRQTVQYDFRILKGEVAELYMTVDGVLSKWQHDGKEWVHKRNFNLVIDGEFVILDNGNAIVSLIDKEWCVIQDINGDDPTVHTIAQRVPDEPLVVIHDVGQEAEYFEHAGMLYDRTGQEIAELPDFANSAERMATLVEIVQSNRR